MEILNHKQTPIEDLNLESLPKEIQEKFWEYYYKVPFIRELTKKDRKYAKDLERDEEGKIIVDLEHPHILEDMDYFRQTGLHFQKTGRYTDLRPNPNPNSEYGKWIFEEVRRCHEGMVRPSDGEWIPGDLYYFWNFTLMRVADDTVVKKSTKGKKESKKAIRRVSMPSVWDGHYLLFHYLNQARDAGEHATMLSARGKGKSYIGASLLAKRFELGETKYNYKETTCYITAAGSDFLVAGDQTLDKFQRDIDFVAQNTEFPRTRLSNRLNDMQWVAGYKDLDRGNVGVGNSVVGITSKNNSSKLRGTRAVLYILEEAGSFSNLLQVWNNMLPSVEQGQGDKRKVFGQAFAYGTAGDSQSDFYAMAEMMYHPEGYHIYALNNIFDLEGTGGGKFSFFFPSYLNNEGCYDKDGNSDITAALKEILKARYETKKKTSDINAIIKATAENPIVPQEAILRTTHSMFPVAVINERIHQLENNLHEYDDVYVGELVQNPNGVIEFKPTNDTPIRNFSHKDSKIRGALEIYKMPEKDSANNVIANRYIIGHDPVDHDEADSVSLSSTFVLDLFTDSIVAEYTGRRDFAEENYEILRKLCIFYNAKCLYENNIRGCYAYFSKMNSLYMLAETPEYLKDRDIVKRGGYGNTSRGVCATKPVNDYANSLIRDWLLKPKTIVEQDNNGNEIEVTVQNVSTVRNLAFLKELSQFCDEGNYDRVRAFGLVMLYREEFHILNGDNFEGRKTPDKDPDYLGNDPFFKKNYDEKLVITM